MFYYIYLKLLFDKKKTNLLFFPFRFHTSLAYKLYGLTLNIVLKNTPPKAINVAN